MNKSSFLNLLEQLLEMDKGSLRGSEKLDSLRGWDSLAVVGFIALADRQFNVEVPAHAVTAAKTVGDLIGLLGAHIED